MKDIFRVLGLADSADEAAAVSAIGQLTARASLVRDIEALTEKEGAEAIGVVRAWKGSETERAKLVKSNDELRKTADKTDFDAAIAKGKDDQKLTPATAKHYADKFEAAVDHEAVTADLRGFLAVAPKVTPDAVKQPSTKGAADAATTPMWNGKTFADLKPMQRHELKDADPATYNLMRDHAKANRLVA